MPDLLDLARRVAEQATADEEVEVYVARGRETSIRVFEGAIEELTARRVGRRRRAGDLGREGKASPMSGHSTRRPRPRRSSRPVTTPASPPSTSTPGSPSPDGVEPPVLDLWREELVSFPTEDKVALALELERQVRAGDARIRQVVSSDYVDGLGETAIATSSGIEASEPADPLLPVRPRASPGTATTPRPASATRWAERPGELDLEAAAADAVDRATRLLGAKKPRSARLTAVLDRRVTATLLGILSGTLSGEEVVKGRCLFAGRVGEQVGVGGLTLVDDPTNPLAYGASRHDAEGLACRRNSLIAGGELQGLPLQHLRGAPRRDGVDRLGRARRLPDDTWRRRPGALARARGARPGGDHRPGRRGIARAVDHRGALGRQPRERRLLRRRRGTHDPRR